MSDANEFSLPTIIVEAGLAAIPVVGGTLSVLWRAAQDRDRHRVQEMGEALRDQVADDELLVGRLTENERLVDMLIEAGDAARRSAWGAKRVAMGRVVAHAVLDDAEIDDDAQLLSALVALDRADFRVLAQLAEGKLKEAGSGPVTPEPYRSRRVASGTVRLIVAYGGRSLIESLSEFGERLLAWVKEPEAEESAP